MLHVVDIWAFLLGWYGQTHILRSALVERMIMVSHGI